MLKDYLKLHFIVLIWGFTAILGVLISLPPIETVFYRTLITSAALLWFCRSRLYVPWQAFIKIFLIGTLVGLHWILFFASVNVGSASIGLAGLSTVTLWTALLEPLVLKRPHSLLEVLLGLAVIGGLYLIFQYETDQSLGLLLGIAAALVACVFSVFNALMVRNYHHQTITMYGMLGACSVSLVFIAVGAFLGRPAQFSVSGEDCIWLAILSLVCTVYPYSEAIELLKRLSVFAANLSVNMEPIYGMILAAIFFGEHNQLTRGFYSGAAVIITAILIYLGASKRGNAKLKARARAAADVGLS